jgi:protein-disulfide isomerase/uncharacterized membrane protein
MQNSANKKQRNHGPSSKDDCAASEDRARLLNRLIFGVALFGLLITVHLWIQSERGFSHGCFGLDDPADVGVVECSAVVQSSAGKLFGISNIVYGFFFFGAIAALSFASILSRASRIGSLRRASLIVASLGIAYALYLFSYQVFVLGQFCKLCLTTGFTTAVIFLLHALEWAGKAVMKLDLAALVREVGLFILMLFVAAMLLVAEVFFLNKIGTMEYGAASSGQAAMTSPSQADVRQPSSRTQDPPEQAAAQAGNEEAGESEIDPEALAARLDQMCRFDPGMPVIQDVSRLVSSAPYVGDDTASVSLIEFFDPNCPHCKDLHDETAAIMSRLGGKAKLYFMPYPIWPYSFPQVEALYQAADEGLFHQMLEQQMRRQKRGGLSVDELTEIAGSIGMDTDRFRRDLNSGKHRTRVNRERAQIGRLGISGVPKMAVQDRFLVGRSVNPVCIEHLVNRAHESAS